METDFPIEPADIDELAIILARGYLRYRESRRRQLSNPLASTPETSPYVRAVDRAENGECGPDKAETE